MVCFFALRGRNFLNLFFFWTIFSVSDAPIRGVQVLFGHHNIVFAHYILDKVEPFYDNDLGHLIRFW
jgi:hypothetical protein